MRDKHIHIPAESELLKRLNKKVEEKLVFSEGRFHALLWTKFVVYLSLMIVCYVGLFYINDLIWFLLDFIFLGFVSFLFAFNFSHDFSHDTVFKSKFWNNLGYSIIYTLVGAHAEAWKLRHIHSHHYAPNVEGYDTDLKITNLIRVLPTSKYKWYHRFQHYYAPIAYTTYSLYWVFIKDFVILFSKEPQREKKGFLYFLSFIVQKSVYVSYLLVLPLLFAKFAFYWVLVGFLLMHAFESLFLLFTFFMTHHVEATEYPGVDSDGFIQSSWVMNQIKSSNDMDPFSEAANFIFGGFNNHIAHHLYPHIHHVYYPQLSRILYDELQKNGINPNQTSYWGGIVSHLKLLQRFSSAAA